MVINRNDINYQGGGQDNNLRPETSSYQNYNWNAHDNNQQRNNGMLPPTTAAGA